MLCQCRIRFRHRDFSASFVDLVLGFETSLATVAFSSRMARFSAVEAEHYLALLSVKTSASAVESFENATAFGSMIVHFAVHASVLFIIVFVSSTVSAEVSSSSALAISFAMLIVESGSD
jgi:hypothetical protein